jgi:acyl-CoA thioesterase I
MNLLMEIRIRIAKQPFYSIHTFKLLSISLIAVILLVAGTATAQIKVACIGNSITAGATVAAGQAYPERLQQLLGTGYTVQNEGVTTTTMLKDGDTPYWTRGKLSQVWTFQPAIVTIKLGTNDTKTQNWDAHYALFKRDYAAMIDTLNRLTSKPKIWLILPVPIWANSFDIRDSALQKIIPIINQIAAEKGLPVIDANTPLKNFKSYFPDGVHPNAAGQDTIAHVVYRALKSTAARMPAIQAAKTPYINARFLGNRLVVSAECDFHVILTNAQGGTLMVRDGKGSVDLALDLHSMAAGVFFAAIMTKYGTTIRRFSMD